MKTTDVSLADVSDRSDAIRDEGAAASHRLAEHLGPAVLVLYLIVNFQPLELTIPLPPLASWLVFPAGVMAVLLVSPAQRIGRIPLSFGLLAVIGWWTMSYLWSEDPTMTRYSVMSKLLPLLFLALLVGLMRAEVVIRTLLGVVIVVGAWSLVTSLVIPASRTETLAGTDELQLGFRGMFIHKNLLGMFMVYGLCLVLPFMQTRARPWVIGLCVVLVLGTRSATAGSGLMAVLFTWFWILAIDRQKSKRERQFMLVISLAAVFSAIMLALGLMPTLLGIYEKDFTFSGRTYIWEASMAIIALQPLQGYGYSGLWYDVQAPVTRALHQRIGFEAAHAHSGVIELLLQVGVIGMGLFAAFLVRTVGHALWAFNRSATSRLGQWALLTVVSMLLMSVSEPLFEVPHMSLLVIISTVLLGLRNAEARRSRRGSVSEGRSDLAGIRA